MKVVILRMLFLLVLLFIKDFVGFQDMVIMMLGIIVFDGIERR